MPRPRSLQALIRWLPPVLAVWLCLATACARADTVGIPAAAGRVNLGPGLEILQDPRSNFSATDINRRPGWLALQQDSPNLGYIRHAVWLRVRLHNPSTQTLQRLLEIGNPVLDHLEVWLTPTQGAPRHWRLGDKLPFPQRPVEHRNFLIPVELAPQSHADLLLRLETGSAVQTPVRLWQPDRFRAEDETNVLVLGAYFGIMLSMLLYNGFLYVSLRERQYAWYCGYVSAISIFLASLDGLSFQYLWPNATTWNDQVLVLSLALTLFFGALFARDFLHLRSAGNLMRRCMDLTLGFAVLSALSTFLVHYTIAIHLVEACAVVAMPTILSFSVYRALKGYQPARFYIGAWSFVLLSGMVLAMDKYGLIEHTTFSVVAVPMGSAMQILLLSFALGDRVQRERRLREEAHADMLRMQQETNTVLERRVQERTGELMAANRKLQELTVTDALTGVHNRRHFDEVLRQEVKRALRSGDHLGLLIIDADHFKHINDTWGHPAGDACLRAIARVLQEQVHRECDTVARFGGEEFCLVLPSTDSEGVAHVAEKLRTILEQTPIAGPQGPIRLTVSIGAVSVVPEESDDGVRLLATADAALYMAKQSGRNRVSVRHSLD